MTLTYHSPPQPEPIPGLVACPAPHLHEVAVRYCPTCGLDVAHQPSNLDDSSHCPCRPVYDTEYGVGYEGDCTCDCHGEAG